VGLVDDDEVDGRTPEGLEEGRVSQPLRSRKNELALILFDAIERRFLLGGRDAAVDLEGVEAACLELVDLILHERDQGRDDDRGACQVQGGQLVAQGFPCSGRHDGQGVPAVQHRLHDLVLAVPQPLDSEGPPEGVAQLGHLLSRGAFFLRTRHRCLVIRELR
jgi:hypothetical protein